MNLSDDVDLEDYVSRPEKLSGAEIACVVQEAGMHAVRANRYIVMPKDFEKGYKVRRMHFARGTAAERQLGRAPRRVLRAAAEGRPWLWALSAPRAPRRAPRAAPRSARAPC